MLQNVTINKIIANLYDKFTKEFLLDYLLGQSYWVYFLQLIWNK